MDLHSFGKTGQRIEIDTQIIAYFVSIDTIKTYVTRQAYVF